MQNPEAKQSEEGMRAWLVQRIAAYVRKTPEAIQPDQPFAEYGLDSVYALTLTGDIEDQLGIYLPPTAMWDYPTVDALVGLLVSEQAKA
jgi:acyl carrier protein